MCPSKPCETGSSVRPGGRLEGGRSRRRCARPVPVPSSALQDLRRRARVLQSAALQPASTSTGGRAMSSTNKALIESLYAAFRTGDVATFFAALDPGVVWTEAENIAYADRNPYVGPEQVGEGAFGRLMAVW